MSDPAPTAGVRWGRWLVLGALGAGAALVAAYGPGEGDIIAHSGEWREAARANLPAALGLFALAEVGLIALMLPVGMWLAVLAGFLFGAWVGGAVACAASTAGAAVAFLAARYVLAGPVRRAAATRPRLAAALARVDRGVAAHGAFAVVVLRMTPVFPFWLVNLGAALTPLRLRTYVAASCAGMLPLNAVAAVAGAGLAEITTFREALPARTLAALVALPVALLVIRYAAGKWRK